MKLLFDLETTGLLRRNSQIHCVVIRNLDDEDSGPLVFDTVKDNVDEGIQMLERADMLAGHNIIGFDLALIEELYPDFKCPALLRDTLIMSRCYYSDLEKRDFERSPFGLPKRLYGRHSLEAWGIRLGEEKSDFGKTSDWQTYTEEMLKYCIQDCNSNVALFKLLSTHEDKYK